MAYGEGTCFYTSYMIFWTCLNQKIGLIWTGLEKEQKGAKFTHKLNFTNSLFFINHNYSCISDPYISLIHNRNYTNHNSQIQQKKSQELSHFPLTFSHCILIFFHQFINNSSSFVRILSEFIIHTCLWVSVCRFWIKKDHDHNCPNHHSSMAAKICCDLRHC